MIIKAHESVIFIGLSQRLDWDWKGGEFAFWKGRTDPHDPDAIEMPEGEEYEEYVFVGDIEDGTAYVAALGEWPDDGWQCPLSELTVLLDLHEILEMIEDKWPDLSHHFERESPDHAWVYNGDTGYDIDGGIRGSGDYKEIASLEAYLSKVIVTPRYTCSKDISDFIGGKVKEDGEK